MDTKNAKAAVVSILPMKLYEFKPGVYPAAFHIAAADFSKKEIVTVPVFDAVRYQYIGEMNGGSVQHQVAAFQVANAVVNDYAEAKMCVFNADEPEKTARPGLLAIDEYLGPYEVKSKYKAEIELLFIQQNNWFLRLAQVADDDWVKYQNHKIITDEQRLAANCLQLERDWNIDIAKAAYIKCSYCQTSISISAIICPSCKEIVKPEAYKKLKAAREAILEAPIITKEVVATK